MSTKTIYLVVSTIACLQSACVLGDEGVEVSPYETAYFDDANVTGVADGLTPVSVVVHGDPGSTLTLVARSATFVGGSEEQALSEKTVQLDDLDASGLGVATVQLVSSTPGLARLSFKLAPVAVALDVEFEPIRFLLDAPIAIELRPGAVAHQGLRVHQHGARSPGAQYWRRCAGTRAS